MSRQSSGAPARDRVLTQRASLCESILAREGEAMERLAAVTGGQSLCGRSTDTRPVSGVKYYEGMAAALADARRAVCGQPGLRGEDDASRLALHAIRARWTEESHWPGCTGPDWVDYLAGGLDALTQLLDGHPAR